MIKNYNKNDKPMTSICQKRTNIVAIKIKGANGISLLRLYFLFTKSKIIENPAPIQIESKNIDTP